MGELTERPILFSGPMVRAILEGRKEQTRRVLNPHRRQLPIDDLADYEYNGAALVKTDNFGTAVYPLPTCPYGFAGDRLWVRETWADVNTDAGPGFILRADGCRHLCCDDAYPVEYERYPGCQFTMWVTDLERGAPEHRWRPSIYMPRWLCRLELGVLSVRVERLQDISADDARAEGIPIVRTEPTVRYASSPNNPGEWESPVEAFRCWWDYINGKREGCAWSSNPFVWAVSFKRIERSILGGKAA